MQKMCSTTDVVLLRRRRRRRRRRRIFIDIVSYIVAVVEVVEVAIVMVANHVMVVFQVGLKSKLFLLCLSFLRASSLSEFLL